ncbi:MAG TPA: pyrroloquinoline quinone-dependent dehydrogenase [Gemmatimonadaceae bacterium]|nr:pyrroloquinoline quinone-dependent dehydrogenase [Gemmatimonadaceae bacterium]
MKLRRLAPAIAAAAVALPTLLGAQSSGSANADWPVYHGTPNNDKYTTLSQITPDNVNQLKVAWTYDTRDGFDGSEMEDNPIVVDGVLYATSPKLRVFALDAATGRELWSFDPTTIDPRKGRYRHRGVTVAGDRVFVTHRHRLWALDRKTGRPVAGFGGDSGFVDLRAGLGRDVNTLSVNASSPGVVYGDLFIIGSTVSESLPSAPGDIRAYDVKTGAMRWIFHTIPRPGEYGYATWPKDAWKVTGGANAWSGVTLDPTLGIVFAATGSAAFDFYGSNRHGDDLFANTLLALDARTGKRLWHFQGVKHDLWDRDFPTPPTLVTLTRGGRRIDAVAQPTKTGQLFVFERKTGKPVFPVKYVNAPRSKVPGERSAATQPESTLPPYTRQVLTERDLTTRTPEAHAFALKTYREFNGGAPGGKWAPPSTKGTIVFPGYDGGAEYGGGAFDPATGMFYINANEMAWLLRMELRSDKSLYSANCASCHKEDRTGSPPTFPSLIDVGKRRTRDDIAAVIRGGSGRMPAFGEKFDSGTINDIVEFLLTGHDIAEKVGHDPTLLKYRNNGYDIFLDQDGYPAISPPWGTLTAIDLNRGKIAWQIPFGEYPELVAKGMRNTGSDNYGGPVVTANGILFIAATSFDKKLHAYDKKTGKLLWEGELPFAGGATPSVYMVNGREYIVIACGGGKYSGKGGGTYVAFALPESR